MLSQFPSLELSEEPAFKTGEVGGIGLPPGLEDMLEPREASARFIMAQAALSEVEAANDIPNGLQYPLQQASDSLPTFQENWMMETPQKAHNNLDGVPHLLSTTPFDTRQCPEVPQCLDMGMDDGTMETMQYLPNEFDISNDYQSSQFWLESMEQPLLWDGSMEATHVDHPQEAREGLSMEYATADFSTAWTLHQSQEYEFGSSQYPTVGSQAHPFGTCTPCAFVYTKGCSNGVLCSFCHLCDMGERKRRAKDKRTAKKGPSMQW
jgi:hypothetical protein